MTAPRLLFVCLGNICRSPAAEGVMRALAARDRLALEIDSAGTGAWHVGNPPDPRMRAAAAARGFPIDDLRARQAEAADFHRFDMILAMDRANFRDLRTIAPKGTEDRLSLMLSHGSGGGGDVPDPYYGGDAGFDHVLDLLEDACEGLMDKLGR